MSRGDSRFPNELSPTPVASLSRDSISFAGLDKPELNPEPLNLPIAYVASNCRPRAGSGSPPARSGWLIPDPAAGQDALNGEIGAARDVHRHRPAAVSNTACTYRLAATHVFRPGAMGMSIHRRRGNRCRNQCRRCRNRCRNAVHRWQRLSCVGRTAGLIAPRRTAPSLCPCTTKATRVARCHLLTQPVTRPAEGIGPSTSALQKRCSTVELRWHIITASTTRALVIGYPARYSLRRSARQR